MIGWFNRKDHQQALLDWLLTDGQSWIYVGKMLLAMSLAVYCSMLLQLPHANSAALTVVVIMQPQAGQVFAKSVARIVGTVIGLALMMVMVALFHQQPVMFVICTAIACGILAAGAVHYRDMRAYACILAGITIGLIGLPAGETPDVASMNAVNRMLAVVIGIVCCGLVSALVMPVTTTSLMARMLAGRLRDMGAHAARWMEQGLDKNAQDQLATQLASQAVSFDALRKAASTEAPKVSQLRHQLIRLNHQFMAVSTRLQSLGHTLDHLRADDSAAGRHLQQYAIALTEPVIEAMNQVAEQPRRAADTEHLLRQFDLVCASLKGSIRRHREQLLEELDAKRIAGEQVPVFSERYETLAEQLYRLTDEFRIYLERYAQLSEERVVQKHAEEINEGINPHVNPLYVFATGARSTSLILIVAAFWMLSGWSGGLMAVQNAIVVAVLTATASNPAAMAKPLSIGAAIGYSIGFFITHFLLPHVDGFLLMILCVLPVFAVGSFITLKPKLMGLGLGTMVNFCFVAIPDNPPVYDPALFVNNSIAGVTGFIAGSVIIAVLFPPSGRWLSRLLIRDLRQLVDKAIHAPLSQLASRIDSQSRDILNQTYGMTVAQANVQRELLDWYHSVNTVSHAVLELRQTLEAAPDPRETPIAAEIRRHIHMTLEELAALYHTPTAGNYRRALASLDSTLDYLRPRIEPSAVSFTHAKRRQLLSDLHFIQAALISPSGPFASYQPTSSVQSGACYVA